MNKSEICKRTLKVLCVRELCPTMTYRYINNLLYFHELFFSKQLAKKRTPKTSTRTEAEIKASSKMLKKKGRASCLAQIFLKTSIKVSPAPVFDWKLPLAITLTTMQQKLQASCCCVRQVLLLVGLTSGPSTLVVRASNSLGTGLAATCGGSGKTCSCPSLASLPGQPSGQYLCNLVCGPSAGLLYSSHEGSACACAPGTFPVRVRAGLIQA